MDAFGAPLPRAEQFAETFATAQDFSQRAQAAIESAKEGNTTEALNGNMFVTQAIFSELLKKSQIEVEEMKKDVLEMKREAEDKKAKIAQLVVKLNWQLAVSRSRGTILVELEKKLQETKANVPPARMMIILHQAGYPTASITYNRETTLSDAIAAYANFTDQDATCLLAIQSDRLGFGNVIHDPESHELVPEEHVTQLLLLNVPMLTVNRDGKAGPAFESFQLVKVSSSERKRKTTEQGARSAKKQKI